MGSLLNEQNVIVEDGVAKLFDRTSFTGNFATSDRLVRTMYKTSGVSLFDAVKIVTTTPASIIGALLTSGAFQLGRMLT